ncbi:MMPL family transporter [Paenibacillus macquariensis]|uniref:Drug exporter of the RND superfamily n=1 Tax=Paenibacillus macquariensis TaxID=948756 RepID=A0ABY1JZD5_9BACL|nr:MMPL family transporter [Paenibacillus macquariensis]MEC0091232.1 MMPL family transporter [Paenibacillus macquariensis]SIR02371.1 putative drug exporter of the RND superfamily [Paenibacillus macquariensis]
MGYRMLANLSFRFPTWIIVLWTAFFVVFGTCATNLPAVLKDHGLVSDGSFAQVQQILSSEFGIPDEPIMLVFEKESSVTTQQFHRYIENILMRMRSIEGLTSQVSPNDREGMSQGNVAYALLGFRQHSYEIGPVLEQIRQQLSNSTPKISVGVTGKSVIQYDVNQASRHGLKTAELIGLPIAFVILLFAFRGVVFAVLPLIIGMIGVTGTLGIMALIGTKIELSNFVLSVIPMVGLALSIDFSLMIISRFQEELSGRSVEQTLITSMRTAGRAVMFSALCVILGLLAIQFIHLPIFTTVALGAMVVLIISLFLNLTLLPALLGILGPFILATRQKSERGKKSKKTLTTGFWDRWSLTIMKRPIVSTLIAMMVLLSCLVPIRHMIINIPDATSLPRGYESRTAAELYNTHFTSTSSSEVVAILEAKNATFITEDWIRAYQWVKRLKQDPGVIKIESVFDRLPLLMEQDSLRMLQNPIVMKKIEPMLQSVLNDNKMLIRMTIQGAAGSKIATEWLRNIESKGAEAELPLLVGGEAKYQQEIFDEISSHLVSILLFIGVTNFIVLCIAFRSILIPLKAIVMNLLSLGASFGILVFIFEKGRLGLEASPIAVMIPIFVFGLVFGISMDYGVFLLSRMSEVYERTGDHVVAVTSGLSSTGRIITSAAAIMIAVTLPFAFADVIGVKQLGIGIAAAIFIDATIIRLILVPSLMVLFGRMNWWMPFQKK